LLSGGGDVTLINNRDIADLTYGAGQNVGLFVDAGGGKISVVNTDPNARMAGGDGVALLKTSGTGDVVVNFGGEIHSRDGAGTLYDGFGINTSAENGNTYITYSNSDPLNPAY